MKYLNLLIKPASSLCQLRCKYCFYADVSENREIKSYDIMDPQTRSKVIKRCLEAYHEECEITWAFQGGEPTMAGLNWFIDFVNEAERMKKPYHHLHYAIQTNGTIMDESWMPFLKKYYFLVGVSLDGYKAIHDSVRIDAKGQGTFDKIMETINLLKKYEIDFNILTVLTDPLSKHPEELFKFYLDQKLDFIQLIPCLPALDGEKDPWCLTPHQFFNFYDRFFTLWKEEFEKGRYISITLFDNLIPMYAGIPPQQCGYLGQCTMQNVVEADGSVYPCDFYVLDQYKVGNLNKDSITALAKRKVTKRFLEEKHRRSNRCDHCKHIAFCHGQCKRMNVCYFDEEYCGLEEFFDKHGREMRRIAERIKAKS